jgi:long-chain acyl-CoA synthetase
LPGRLAHFARTRGARPALRHKQLGIWQEISWGEYFAATAACARMLWEIGVRPGDHVAILSDNRPEWLYADLAAQLLGARAVGVYQTSPAEDVSYILNHSRASVLFCEDQEQVDKLMQIRAQTPALERAVVFEPRGTRGYDEARLSSWQSFLAEGQRLLASDAGFVETRLASLDPAAPTMVVYTSGTTGQPKGAMISANNVIPATDAIAALYAASERDVILSYLPLCHVAEKIYSVFLPLSAGLVVHFGESIDTVQEDLREVSPTIFLGVPRIWEKLYAQVTVKMKDASWLPRALFGFFTRRGAAIAERRRAGRAGAWDRVLWRLGDLLVYRPLQERLGLRRCRRALTGAAPISPDLIRWYHGIGVPLIEGYGQTECAGISHCNRPGRDRIGTVGTPVPLLETRIAEDGEVLVRGPNVFCGYLNQPEATAAAVDPDGWLHTGDLGEIDRDGYLTITGRKKDLIITAGGKNLSPEKIENALKTSPYVKEAISIGDRRRFVSALVQIDLDSVGDWATRRGLPYTSYADLAAKPEVIALIAEAIDAANELLVPVEQVKAFRILPKELSQDDGELTATQKVRRRAVTTAFGDVIESMFGGGRP